MEIKHFNRTIKLLKPFSIRIAWADIHFTIDSDPIIDDVIIHHLISHIIDLMLMDELKPSTKQFLLEHISQEDFDFLKDKAGPHECLEDIDRSDYIPISLSP